jgi:hypothetical protein
MHSHPGTLTQKSAHAFIGWGCNTTCAAWVGQVESDDIVTAGKEGTLLYDWYAPLYFHNVVFPSNKLYKLLSFIRHHATKHCSKPEQQEIQRI